ncbi:hypothetical protein A9264_13545 [Vibrio sp. UCD-FRSSP16_10]|uniref:hypothetical protein n=1 Tax=unclassified Vibrio TaxID=2614977 RepID=UPI0007FC9095|nr:MULTISPECIES: hypothetical protein [unclassified Vibrio]OBT14795.1 hypothetical protein A9260_13760 [Vibrio sp. UCD-FRSSP16_30]OBT20084.1 hypothetical protein A9264_13545 [Vibrio sp. UCD-FRSSP16_10]
MSEQNTAEFVFGAFQKALNTNSLVTAKGELFSDLLVYLDQPDGETRYSYALMGNGTRVKALCVATVKDSEADSLCFDLEIATYAKFRQQGHATSVFEKAMQELKNGLSRNNISSFSVTFNVDKENEAGHAFCCKLTDKVIETEQGKTYTKQIG